MIFWLNLHAWVMFDWCALTPIAPRHLYLLSVGALCAAVGAALGGMQAGPAPMLPPADTLPAIRILWILAATCLLVECGLYLTYASGGGRDARSPPV